MKHEKYTHVALVDITQTHLLNDISGMHTRQAINYVKDNLEHGRYVRLLSLARYQQEIFAIRDGREIPTPLIGYLPIFLFENFSPIEEGEIYQTRCGIYVTVLEVVENEDTMNVTLSYPNYTSFTHTYSFDGRYLFDGDESHPLDIIL